MPYVPLSHPFVELLIGTIRRECLDRTLFWTAADLERTLLDFQRYYNGHRTHAGLDGRTPEPSTDPVCGRASVSSYRWQLHCRGLYQTPMADVWATEAVEQHPKSRSVDRLDAVLACVPALFRRVHRFGPTHSHASSFGDVCGAIGNSPPTGLLSDTKSAPTPRMRTLAPHWFRTSSRHPLPPSRSRVATAGESILGAGAPAGPCRSAHRSCDRARSPEADEGVPTRMASASDPGVAMFSARGPVR